MDTPEITPERSTFRRPADYYASPIQHVRPIFPRWVPFGCGTASIVIIIVLVGVAAAASSGAFTGVFEYMFASMQTEVDKMMTPEVKPPQKASFDAEMKALREGVRGRRLKLETLQPFMRLMRDVVSDERVTPAEVDQLTRDLHALNTSRK